MSEKLNIDMDIGENINVTEIHCEYGKAYTVTIPLMLTMEQAENRSQALQYSLQALELMLNINKNE